MIYVQRIFDSGLGEYVYYTLGVVTATPDSGQTSPNHSGVLNLVAGSHAIITTQGEGQLTVLADGLVLTSNVTSIDFLGNSATVVGDAVTVLGGGGGPTFEIASYAKTAPNGGTLTYRRGDTLTGVTASATYTLGPPTSASIANTLGGSSDGGDIAPGSWTILTPFASGSMAGSVKRSGSDLGADPTMTATLSATKSAVTDQATFVVTWTRDVYYGVGAAGLNTEVQIEALATSLLSGTRARTLAVTPSTQKVYYAYPKAYGTATFTLGGFPFDMLTPFELSMTNVNGVTSTYYVYESTNLLSGSISIIVT